ncbi:MAG: hypothetical protein ACRC62_18880 [Microcoleus sp.]
MSDASIFVELQRRFVKIFTMFFIDICRCKLSVRQGEAFGYMYFRLFAKIIAQMLRPYMG